MKKHKKLLIFLLLGILLLCGCSATSSGLSLLHQKKITELTQKGEPYWAAYAPHQEVGEALSVVEYESPFSYLLQYPKTDHPGVDARIQKIVAEIRAGFNKSYSPEGTDPKGDAPIPATLYLGYEAYLTDEAQMSLVLFETHETAGGVSPHTQIHIYHFDLSKDQEVSASTLMWTDFRENASRYTQEYFTSKEPYRDSIFGNYATLLEPSAGRFDRFALTSEGVKFYFDRYDLFPGSLGIVSLTIPYADMQTKIVVPEEPEAPPLSKDQKMVALSFDDGPNPIATNAILDTLEKYNARATFFDLGYLVEKYPDVVKREAALGCEVASHSYDHKDFSKLTAAQIKKDVEKTDAAFRKALGTSPAAFRPPFGATNDTVKQNIPLPLYLWSVDTLDWKSRNAQSVMNLVKNAGDLDGKVILLHGIYGSSAEATAQLVPYLQKQGYTLVTVSELIQTKYGETPQQGKLYGYSYFQ